MTPRRNKYIHLTILSFLLLAGCSTTPDYQRPDIETPAWKAGETSANTEIAYDWWKSFGSNELNVLMQQALDNNNDLQASLHRIEQARGELQIAGASLLPSANVTLQAMNGPLQAFNITDRRNNGVPDFTANAGISYELDLFGANTARVEAEKASLLSSQYAHEALALIVMGDVAQGYFSVINLQERYRIAKENVQSISELLEVVEARFQNGSVTALDVAQQETVLSNAKAELAAIEQKLALAENALAVVLGQPPQTLDISSRSLKNIKPPKLIPLQPSALLERRPDIKFAEANLIEANANIGAAKAAYFPSINLGTNLLLAANPSASALALFSSVSAPIFQGGRLEGNLRRAEGKQAELVEYYKKAILLSFKEAEDALAKTKTSNKRETALKKAVIQSEEAYDIAKKQYRLSAVNFQSVISAQQTMLQAKDRHTQARFETLSSSIDLFKAMGGGWTSDKTAAITKTEP